MWRDNPGGSAGTHTKILEQTEVFLAVDKSYFEPLQSLPTTIELSSVKKTNNTSFFVVFEQYYQRSFTLWMISDITRAVPGCRRQVYGPATKSHERPVHSDLLNINTQVPIPKEYRMTAAQLKLT